MCAQIECLLIIRLAEELKWGFIVNRKGGALKNIESDYAQEIMRKNVRLLTEFSDENNGR